MTNDFIDLEHIAEAFPILADIPARRLLSLSKRGKFASYVRLSDRDAPKFRRADIQSWLNSKLAAFDGAWEVQ